MKQWKEQGKIKHIAFSYHDDAAHLDEILTEHPEVEAVQIALNYYDWEEPFMQAKKCYDVIRKHGAAANSYGAGQGRHARQCPGRRHG